MTTHKGQHIPFGQRSMPSVSKYWLNGISKMAPFLLAIILDCFNYLSCGQKAAPSG
jgi:hypothetical protein